MTHQNVKMFSLANTISFNFTPSGRVILRKGFLSDLMFWDYFKHLSNIGTSRKNCHGIKSTIYLCWKYWGILYSPSHNHSSFKIKLIRPLPLTNNVHALLIPPSPEMPPESLGLSKIEIVAKVRFVILNKSYHSKSLC